MHKKLGLADGGTFLYNERTKTLDRVGICIRYTSRGGWMHSRGLSLNKLHKISFLKRVVHQSRYKAEKYHYFVIEFLCEKSDKVVCFTSLLLNFIPKSNAFTKHCMYIPAMLT